MTAGMEIERYNKLLRRYNYFDQQTICQWVTCTQCKKSRTIRIRISQISTWVKCRKMYTKNWQCSHSKSMDCSDHQTFPNVISHSMFDLFMLEYQSGVSILIPQSISHTISSKVKVTSHLPLANLREFNNYFREFDKLSYYYVPKCKKQYINAYKEPNFLNHSEKLALLQNFFVYITKSTNYCKGVRIGTKGFKLKLLATEYEPNITTDIDMGHKVSGIAWYQNIIMSKAANRADPFENKSVEELRFQDVYCMPSSDEANKLIDPIELTVGIQKYELKKTYY